MGTDIDQEEFSERDYARFAERLEECLSALGQLLERPGFGAGPATIGAELELFLVDGAARPLPHNQAIRAAVADPRVTVELDRFNLELNASPVLLAGRPFAALGGELNVLLDRVADAATDHAGRPALIGILPTLSLADLGPGVMTDVPRYRALNSGLRRLRRDPFRIRIAGADPLELASEMSGWKGRTARSRSTFGSTRPTSPAPTTRSSWPRRRCWPCPATRPPFLATGCGKRHGSLCSSSRSTTARATGPRRRLARTALGTGWLRGGALELFTESVRLHQPLLPVLHQPPPPVPGDLGLSAGGRWQAPPLDELRLHQGTVWRWNRAIYDPTSGGHLRIEMRALPAGPTVIDMLANAAFLIGLSLWLAGQDQQWTYALPFERADHGFYRAAQQGLSARLTWPAGHRDQIRTLTAAKLVAELVPAARQGLLEAGVAAAEADGLLEVISARAASRPDRRRLAARHPRRRRAASRPRASARHHARPLPSVRRYRAARPHLASCQLTRAARPVPIPGPSRPVSGRSGVAPAPPAGGNNRRHRPAPAMAAPRRRCSPRPGTIWQPSHRAVLT